MPRVARFKVAAVSELLQQLRFAPEKTRLRQMYAAEKLIAEIDRTRNYPQDFIVFRITGYRPETDASTMLVGEALLPDLVNLVLQISKNLHLKRVHDGRTARRLDEIAKDLHISGKSLQRYRTQGLVCHYVYFEDDRQLLACFDDSLQRFIHANEQRLQRAGGFTRIDDDRRQVIIESARTLHEKERLSLNEAAQRIANEHNRAHETIRVMLRKHDRRSDRPIFIAPGPVSERDARLLHRAWLMQIPIALMAERFHKTPTTIHRAINRRRASLLEALNVPHVDLPTFTLDDAASVILSHASVTTNLDERLPENDALELIAAVRAEPPLDEDAEQAMIAACNFLKRRARLTIDAFSAWPGSRELDAAETDLRWADKLQRRLVAFALPAALRSIEQHLHRALDDHPADVIVKHMQLAVHVAAGVTNTIDPSRGQRLTRLTRQAVDRALAASSTPREFSRAAMRHRDNAVQLRNCLFANVTPWAWLNTRHLDLRCLEHLDDDLGRLIELRHGLGGKPPRTCEAIARQLGRTPSSVARKLATAERQLRQIPRG